MTTLVRGLARLTALALLVSACSAAATSTVLISSPPTSTLGPIVNHTPSPSLAQPPSASPSPSPSTAYQPIPDGTYVGKPLKVADIRAEIMADAKLTATDRAELIDREFVLGTHTTLVISLDFHGGQFTEREGYDGGPRDVGARATYAFPDAHTWVIQESCCLTTFQVSVTGTTISLKRLSASPDTELDVMGTRIVYESTPFTLEP